MKIYNNYFKILIALILLIIISIFSLSYGDSQIGFFNSAKALFGLGDKTSIIIVQNIRLPRVFAGILAGTTLALSGLLTRTALKNPLADSSILGIQSGASVFALFSILVIPKYTSLLPLFSFFGGLLAFILVILFSYHRGFNPVRLVLSGVAVNSFFMAITSIITITHVNELRNSIQWSSGSLVGISMQEVSTMFIYSLIIIVLAYLTIPMLELLRLEDKMLISLGKNPNTYRCITCILAVMLASISLSFVGVIVFVGIIIPHISQLLIGSNMKQTFIMTIICGAILVVGVDLFSRIIFTVEMPVGALIGILGAPLFLYLLRGAKNGI
ncbi:MAG: FecCD family ABC transporter permease [Mycoplasmatales bacterium]